MQDTLPGFHAHPSAPLTKGSLSFLTGSRTPGVEKSFRHAEAFSELQKALKNEDVQDTLPGFPHTPSAPLTKGSLSFLTGSRPEAPVSKNRLFATLRHFQSFKKL